MSERRVVRSLNVRSVVRVAFVLSVCVWGIAFVGLVALYLLGLVSGGLGGVEGFIASLGFTDFRLSMITFLAVFVVAAAVASAVFAVLSGVLAHLYNAVFPLVGGVEVTIDDRAARPEPVRVEPSPAPTQTAPVVAPPRPSPPVAQPQAVPPWPQSAEPRRGDWNNPR